MTDERCAYRPKRHLRNEIYSLVLVMAAPIGVIAVFPYASLSFSASAGAEVAPRRSFCSFVALTDEQAEAAVQSARSSIRTAHEGISALLADLSISSVPVESGCVADVSERSGPEPVADATYNPLPLPPSLAAPPPQRIPSGPAAAAPSPAFSRDEMLEIFD